MRQKRLKAPEHFPVAYYHCVSRVVNREYVFGNFEKEQFVKFMRKYAAFCGVEIVTFCVMSNHFHILVEVPKRPEVLPDDEGLLLKLKQVFGKNGEATQRLQMLREIGAHEEAEAYKESFFCRMWDVSAYMKLVKQHFTQWFNRHTGRKGTLWEERFRSVLVEGSGRALVAMAAYIDLNPIRARIVEDPHEYRWCGYAEAVAGKKEAMAGLAIALEAAAHVSGGVDRHGKRVGNITDPSIPEPRPRTAKDILREYRMLMYLRGAESHHDQFGIPQRAGFSREAIAAVIASNGKLSLGELLQCKVRYFVDGAVLGSRKFVDEIFRVERHRFGARRTTGARPLRNIDCDDLSSLRDLRVSPVS